MTKQYRHHSATRIYDENFTCFCYIQSGRMESRRIFDAKILPRHPLPPSSPMSSCILYLSITRQAGSICSVVSDSLGVVHRSYWMCHISAGPSFAARKLASWLPFKE